MRVRWCVNDARLAEKISTWGLRKRLEFIEFRLFWEGQLARKDHLQYFAISAPQVKNDLELYEEVTARREPSEVVCNVLSKDKGKKVLAAGNFIPRLVEPDFDDYMAFFDGRWRATWKSRLTLGEQGGFDGPPANWIGRVATIERRSVNAEVVRRLLRAIESRSSLNVEYLAPNYEHPASITISPIYLGHDGFRWHVRAFLSQDGEWKDVVLDRISRASDPKSGAETNGRKNDLGDKDVTISVAPHPRLADHHKQNIAAQYPRMKDGMWSGRMKRSFVPYFLKRYQIEEESLRKEPHQQPLALVDRETVTHVIDPSMRVPPGGRGDPLPSLIRKARAQLGSLETASDLEVVVEALTRLIKQRA